MNPQNGVPLRLQHRIIDNPTIRQYDHHHVPFSQPPTQKFKVFPKKMTAPNNQRPLAVAIVGGGPGGLGTAIALSALFFVSVTLYEQAPEPREVGAGISIGRNAWNVLNLLGAAERVRGGRLGTSWQRNGRTGEVVHTDASHATPAEEKKDEAKQEEEDPRFASIRARRTRLQAALLDKVPDGTIQFGKKLVEIRDLGEGKGVKLRFQDGIETTADFVVGADGIRSVTTPLQCLLRPSD
jgi:salicylate hydroxylase